MKDKKLIVVAGPTGIGKTEYAIQLSAKNNGAPIISADSRQIYREMRIGTARPSEMQLLAAPHHLIGHVSVQTIYSVGDFVAEAAALLPQLFAQHPTVILCGGTGLYINSLIFGLDAFPTVEAATKEKVNLVFETTGLAGWQQLLEKLDPVYYHQIDTQNPARLRRALEICLQSEQPFSSFLTIEKKPLPYQIEGHLLDMPLSDVTARLQKRVDNMMQEGLLEEVQSLLPYRNCRALNTVGYAELFEHLEGKSELSAAVELIKIHTRQYAKRQITWCNKYFATYKKIKVKNP